MYGNRRIQATQVLWLPWKFWLDVEKANESTISDYRGQLKERRQYTSIIRDALRLIRDLRQESLNVLFELFSWINIWLEERAQAIAESMVKNTKRQFLAR